jgi:hypothetical protein
MAAVTAAVAGGSLLLSKLKKKKDAEKQAASNASQTMAASAGGGDGAHTHGGTSGEASDTPAAYKQFEMPGHEHPGIKQRSGAKMKAFDASGGAINGEMTDKVDTDPGSGVKFFIPGMMGGVGGSQSLMDRAIAKHKMKMGKTLNNASATPTVPQHGDESHSGGGDDGAIGVTPDAEPVPGDAAEQPALVKSPKVGAGSRGWGGLVGGAFGGGSGGGFTGMMSDKRLKENIIRIGESPSGIPIYQYNYIGTKSKYKGAMAQDLLNTPHVSLHESGFYMVNYAGIDVDMELIN